MRSTEEGPFPQSDRFAPAKDGARFELEAIGRTLDDLSAAEKRKPPRNVSAKLAWTAAVLIALIIFVSWLLVGR